MPRHSRPAPATLTFLNTPPNRVAATHHSTSPKPTLMIAVFKIRHPADVARRSRATNLARR